ncbi:MAG: SDR family NAD(P)-dependent oxidoreductase, partial [Marivita sp.]|uniref:SDR family NAD(P)-dependent oxidoreductase n=1 Tax=Marivita sp. TaxID=2003365 RepID=UPI003EF60393
MSFSISGKTAIVTGAANGVGLSIAQKFIAKGANVMFVDIDEERLEAELGAVEDEGRARRFSGDLREKLTVANLLSATIDAFERVDILVNASRQMAPSDPLDPDADGMEEMLGQNLMTALRVSQQVAKRMIKQSEGQTEGGAGAIVNLSSIAARRTRPELLAYSVSSAALDQMTRNLAVALAPSRIRVNAVAFGSVMSASLQSSLKDHSDLREDIVDHTPLHRIAGPGAVANAV